MTDHSNETWLKKHAAVITGDVPVDRYIIRGAGPHRGEWAFIYLDEKTGVFTSYSSFGNYAYCWSHIGNDTLKEFLRDLEFDYFMNKTFGPETKIFDFNATIDGMKEYICDARRQGVITKTMARDAWSEIEELEDKQSVDLFVNDVYESRAIYRAYGHDFESVIRMRPNPQCKGFWEIIWPEFLKMIAPAEAPPLAPTEAA